jgi:trans-aconitate 2-methyltransferase
VKGTGLRPYLDALTEYRRSAFLADYTDRIRTAYPATSDGKVLLRFPRFFIVAVKAG